MEKISYYEAREWFWVRTLIWSIPAIIVSVMAQFFFTEGLIIASNSRLMTATWVGLGAVGCAVLAALICIQLPWMREGHWFGFILTAPVCAAVSGFIAFLISGLIFAFIYNDPLHPTSGDVIDSLYKMIKFAIASSGLFGGIFGLWFSLRRDRYFIEQI